MSEVPHTRGLDGRPTLSLYSPDSHDDEPQQQQTSGESNEVSADMTLPEFWREFVVPVCRLSHDSKTIDLERTAMRLWEDCTPNPPIRSITDKTMVGFIEIYRGYPGKHGRTVSAHTVKKQMRMIQPILDLAGPWSRSRRNAQELIDRPPAFPKLDAQTIIRPALSLDEIARWLDACDAPSRPAHLTPPQRRKWHRALITVAYNTGLRIGTVVQLEKNMLGEDGWLDLPARIMKGGKRGGEFYCNAHARTAFKSIWHFPGNLVFQWHDGQPPTSDVIQDEKEKMWKKAKIRKPNNGYHGLRRACLDFVTQRDAFAAQHVAGHAAAGNVLATNYVGPRSVVPRHLDLLPQPRRTNSDPDQMMFDWAP